MKTAAVPKSVTVATANATSRERAAITGAVATTAELPQTAAPTASRTASRGSTLARRARIRTRARAAAIVTITTTVAGTPIRAICSKLRRAPSSTMPRRRTRRDVNASPGASVAVRDDAI